MVKEYVYASSDFDGVKGDSSGKELKIAPVYNFGQSIILRIEDKNIVKKFLEFSKDAAENDAIGYSQKRRFTLVDYCKEGHKIKNLKKRRDCDCSSFITALMYQLGFKSFNYWSYTGTLEQDFRKCMRKYKVPYTVLKYDPKIVKAGDIILNPLKHVVIAFK